MQGPENYTKMVYVYEIFVNIKTLNSWTEMYLRNRKTMKLFFYLTSKYVLKKKKVTFNFKSTFVYVY